MRKFAGPAMLAAVGMVMLASGAARAANITTAVLSRGFSNGKATGITSSFTPKDKAIHVLLRFDAITKTTIKFAWYAVNISMNGRRYRNQMILQKSLPAQRLNYAHGSLTVTKSLPRGGYRVDCFVGGRKVKSLPFTVR